MQNIYSIHDLHPDWVNLIVSSNRSAWSVTTHAVGYNPNDKTGETFDTRDGKITIIARLNNGYGAGTGTIPDPQYYADFAQRCANFVDASKGISYVIIGNEINHAQEQPNTAITLTNYMTCYRLCYDAIKQMSPNVKIGPCAVATWSNLLAYPGNERGDWVKLQSDIWKQCAEKVDALYIHAYTHGYDVSLITDEKRMDSPFQDRYYNFQVYKEFVNAVPSHLKHLPVFITEMNGDSEWTNHNSGWLQAAYTEIDRHNKTPGNQLIYGATLFRWAEHDRRWDISKKAGSIQDLQQALQFDYKYSVQPTTVTVEPVEVKGRTIKVLRETKLRATPGYKDKTVKDELFTLKPDDTGEVVGDSQSVDGLNWLNVRVLNSSGSVTGWLAQSAPDGSAMAEMIGGKLKVGDKVETWANVNVRSGPGRGYNIIKTLGKGVGLEIVGGPAFAEGLVWWNVGEGWAAESVNGIDLLRVKKADLVDELAKQYGIDPKVARAVLAVESGGSGFSPDGNLIIRFEPHVFLDRLTDPRHREKFHELFVLGVPAWKGEHHRVMIGGNWICHHGDQSLERKAFNLARSLNETAAFESASYGAAQIMGFNHADCGYASAKDMYQAFQSSYDEQIRAFFRFLQSNGLIERLRNREFLAFAAGYNGRGQEAYYASLIEMAAK